MDASASDACFFFESSDGCKTELACATKEEEDHGSPLANGEQLNFIPERKFQSCVNIKNEKAFRKCWGIVEEHATKLLKSLNEKAFEDVCTFITGIPEESGGGNEAADDEYLPVAVVFAGINIADNELSFKHLAATIEQRYKGAVATIGSSHCTNISNAVRSMVNQLIENDNDREEEYENISSLEEESSAKNGNPRKRLRKSTIQKRENLVMKQKRVRHTKMSFGSLTPMQALENWYEENGRPLLAIVIEDAASLDESILRQLLSICMCGYHDKNMRFAVILGLTSSSCRGAHGLVPQSQTSKLRLRNFKTRDSLAVLEGLVTDLMILGKLPVRFGSRTLEWLNERFLSKEYSIQSFLRAIKLALMDHFSRNRLGFLCCMEESRIVLTRNEIQHMRTLASFPLKPEQEVELHHVQSWVRAQRIDRQSWAFAFRCVCDAYYEILGKTRASARAIFVDVCCSGRTTLADIRQRLEVSSLSTLLRLTRRWVKSTSSAFGTSDLLHALEKLEEEQSQDIGCEQSTPSKSSKSENSNNRSPPPSSTRDVTSPSVALTPGKAALPNRHWSKAKRRAFMIDSVQPVQGKAVIRARETVLEWFDDLLKSRNFMFWEKAVQHGLPLSECFFYDRVKTLKQAFSAQPRHNMQVALNEPEKYLACKCCKRENERDVDEPVATMHDTCIAFKLFRDQKIRRTISLYDWYQEFCGVLSQEEEDFAPGSATDQNKRDQEKVLQARFIHATSELQSLGLFKHSSRKSDNVVNMVRLK